MSSIKFDASVNVEKLYEELKKANQSFEEFAKTGQKAGESIDKSFEKQTVNLKQQLAQQKQYVKELTDEIKKLENAREGTTGSQRSNINRELGNLRSDLNKETAIMQNLQKQSIESNQKEEQSQGGLISGLGKWAMGLATVTTALHAAKSVIESTKHTADLFEFAVAGAKSGLEQFFRTIATGDWSNFIENIQEAARAGYNFAEAMDKVKEMKWAQEMAEADNELEKFTLLENLRSKTSSLDQRVADGKKYKEIVKEEARIRTETATAEFNAFKDKAKSMTGIDSDRITNSLKQVKKETREKAEEYNKQLKLATTKGGNLLITPAMIEEAKKAVSGAPEEVKIYAEALRGVGKMKESFIIGYVNAYKQVGIAAASGVKGTLRTSTMITGIEAQRKADDEAAAKKSKEDAELENRIKATQEAMKNASGVELANLAAKYVALEKELKIRKDITNQAIMMASDESSSLLPLSMNMGEMAMRTGGTVTSKLATKIDSKEAKSDLIDTTKKSIEANKKAAKELANDQEEIDKQKKERTKDILNGLMDITFEMAKQLGLSEDSLKLMDETMTTISKAAAGDYVGAAFSAMMAITDGLIALAGDFGASERVKGIQKINDLLTEQNKIVEESVRKGQEVEKRSEELRLLKEKQLQLTKNQQQAEDSLNSPSVLTKLMSFIGVAGILARAKQKKKLQEEIAATESEINAVNEQIKQAEQALEDLKVGGITENTLADSIAKGFQEGKTSVNDFADYMNTVLLDAVMNIFKGDILADMQPLLDKVRESLGDKKLTKEEKDVITTEAKRVADENQALWKDLTGSLSLGETSAAKQAGLSGTIQRAITEETGTELAGLFRRNADDTRGIRDYTKLGIGHLMAIESNTGETVAQLKRAVVELQAISTNTKQPYTGKI